MKYTLTARELSNFFGQLGMLIHSGISLTEGLAILHDESQTDTDREIITALLTSMEETGSLTQAMETSGRFPHSSVSYIKTGEETGCLRTDSKCSYLSPDHAWNDGNRYRRSSCKSTSCISAGLSADGDGNEHTFSWITESRKYSQQLFRYFPDIGSSLG